MHEDDINYASAYDKIAPTELLRPLMDEATISTDDIDFFAKSTSVCRTGLNPSEAQITGIFNKTTTISNDASNSLEVSLLPTWELTTGEIVDINDPTCTVTTAVDHRDYYNVNYEESWKTLVVPSQAEVNEYFHKGTKISATSKQLHGYIAICIMIYCPFADCAKNMLTRTALYDGTVSIEVNGIKVSNGTKFSDCDILYHDEYNVDESDNIRDRKLLIQQQRMKFPANENGQYNISVKVNKESTYFQISSIVLW
jgi:signal peptidase I